MMRRDRRSKHAGFTLLELLVAIAVLSLVSLIAWRGLDSLVHTRERLQPRAEEVRELLVAFGQIERDLAQVVNTSFVPISAAPVIVRTGTPAGFAMVRFAPVIEGSPNALQQVIYEVRAGRLVRLSSLPTLAIGASTAAELVETPLLADVQALQIRVWQAGRGWAPPEAASSPNPRAAPAGLEVTVERADGRQYRRVLLVGMG
jgi:general secretion pathway protein J